VGFTFESYRKQIELFQLVEEALHDFGIIHALHCDVSDVAMRGYAHVRAQAKRKAINTKQAKIKRISGY
jgi:hypothetical protein